MKQAGVYFIYGVNERDWAVARGERGVFFLSLKDHDDICHLPGSRRLCVSKRFVIKCAKSAL